MLMQARFRSTCPACNRTIPKGSTIDYNRATRTATHAECAKAPASAPDWSDMAYEDACAAACGPGL